MRHIITCDLSGFAMFFHIISQEVRFKKNISNIKRVFRGFLQILSNTFLILRSTERDMTKYIYFLSCKVPVILVIFQLI